MLCYCTSLRYFSFTSSRLWVYVASWMLMVICYVCSLLLKPLYISIKVIPQRVFHFLKVRQYNQYINLDTVFAVCGGGTNFAWKNPDLKGGISRNAHKAWINLSIFLNTFQIYVTYENWKKCPKVRQKVHPMVGPMLSSQTRAEVTPTSSSGAVAASPVSLVQTQDTLLHSLSRFSKPLTRHPQTGRCCVICTAFLCFSATLLPLSCWDRRQEKSMELMEVTQRTR